MQINKRYMLSLDDYLSKFLIFCVDYFFASSGNLYFRTIWNIYYSKMYPTYINKTISSSVLLVIPTYRECQMIFRHYYMEPHTTYNVP